MFMSLGLINKNFILVFTWITKDRRKRLKDWELESISCNYSVFQIILTQYYDYELGARCLSLAGSMGFEPSFTSSGLATFCDNLELQGCNETTLQHNHL